MQKYIARFNDLLKFKPSLFNDVHLASYNYKTIEDLDVNVLSLSCIIKYLGENNYAFTQKHFDTIINLLTHKKLHSYLSYEFSNYNFDSTIQYSRFLNKQYLLNLFFSKFVITQDQLDLMLSCYKNKYISDKKHYFVWITCLLKQNYVFNNASLVKLTEISYDTQELILKNAFTLVDLENLFKTEITDYKDIKEIISKNNLELSVTSINNLLLSTTSVNMQLNILQNINKNININFTNLETFIKVHSKKESSIIFNLLEFLLLKLKLKEINLDKLLLDTLLPEFTNSYLKVVLILELTNVSCLKMLNLCLPVSDFNYRVDLYSCNNLIEKYNLKKFIINDTFDLVSYILSKPNIIFNKITLENAYSNAKNANILDKFKDLEITKTCLDNCLKNYTYHNNLNIITQVLNSKITLDLHSFKCLMLNQDKFKQETLNLIINNYNFQVDLNIIDVAAQYKCYIKDLERFNINYDEKLYFICYFNDYFPLEYVHIFNINKHILTLRNMCKKPKVTLEVILTFMKTNLVKLDKYCLDALSKKNFDIANVFFRDYKCKPPIMCLCRDVEELFEVKKEIMRNFNIDEKYMSESYEIIN
jgi:hypothetical protein